MATFSPESVDHVPFYAFRLCLLMFLKEQLQSKMEGDGRKS